MKKSIGQLTNEIYGSLEALQEDERIKVLLSVSTLLGINDLPFSAGTGNGGTGGKTNPLQAGTVGSAKNAKDYFLQKDPKNKGELFAVAARYRTETGTENVHTREDLKTVIKTQAGRPFDDRNFPRDIKNTIAQAKFFMGGDHRGEYILSVIGEKYVDALPDRAAAEAARKSVKGTKKAKAAKKSAKK